MLEVCNEDRLHVLSALHMAVASGGHQQGTFRRFWLDEHH